MRSRPLVLALLLALPACPARALDLPVSRAGGPPIAGAHYRGDALELELGRAAARLAHPAAAGPTRRGRVERLGVPGLDAAVAAAGGISLEPEFVGETASAGPGPDFTAFWIVHLAPGTDLASALARLRARPEVRSADPIAVLPVEAMPDDSLWTVSSWYYQPPTRRDIHAPEAWDLTTGDTSIVVAIVDTGVLPYHPDLGGSTAGSPGQMWTNVAERDGLPGVDDDGNGYVDDDRGWDFVDRSSGIGIPVEEDWRDPDNDPNDYAGHGTAVAGLVGALTDNGIGVAGTSWKVRIMPLRIGWSTYADPLGLVDMSYAAQAIRYATRMGANVINCSFSSANQSGLDAAVSAAIRSGVTIVAAAGNASSLHYLGDREDVISVAAVNHDDIVPSFSNRGPWVDLSAPGVDVSSTWLVHADTDSVGARQPAYNALLNGTSFSSPLVAGGVALYLAYVRALGERAPDPRTVLNRVRETTDDISAQNVGITGYGTGRLNLWNLLTAPPLSQAWPGGSRTVGPAVAIQRPGSPPRLVYPTSSQQLLVLDGTTGDTLRLEPLPGVAATQLAGADLGAGRGIGLFIGTRNGMVGGYDESGAPLPGWPVSGPGAFIGFAAGPALGDLDGDGSLEVVCGADDGSVWAWHADGSPVAGFPVTTTAGGLAAPVALSDLDGRPGVEILAATRDGLLFAFDGTGQPVPGWPVTLAGTPTAPVVGRLAAGGGPVVVIGAGTSLQAFDADGTTRFTTTLPGTVNQDPALGDLDHDGLDDVVIPVLSPAELCVVRSDGAMMTERRWPLALSSAVLGPPVLGHLRPGISPSVLFYQGGTQHAYTDSAVALSSFPKPGGAGMFSTLLELDGDGHTEVAAGTALDSTIMVYDAGPGTWSDAPQAWPTPRGNAARTGSRLYAPVLVDVTGPSKVTDLAPDSVAESGIALRWSAPGDDGPAGRAASYDVRFAPFALDSLNFAAGTPVPGAPTPAAAGTVERVVVSGLAENARYWFALRSEDPAGNWSAVSNVADTTTLAVPPGAITDLTIEAVADSSIALRWTATGGDGTTGRPRLYRVHASPAPLDSANFDAAPIARDAPATTDAGGTERLRLTALAPGTHYHVAVVAEDSAGVRSALSNQVQATTLAGGALSGRTGTLIASRAQPGTPPIWIDWQTDPVTRGGHHRIQLFDLSGRLVQAFDGGIENAGTVTWDGRDRRGRRVPAGVYLARLTCGSFHAQTRIVLLP